MKVASPIAGRFGSVKAFTRQVPVDAVWAIGIDSERPPCPSSLSTLRRYSTPSGRSTTSVSGTPPGAAIDAASRSNAVMWTVSPVR